MSSIKKLAGQTVWYGGSSIAARLLNYLLTPYLTLKLSGTSYGEMSLVYAAIPFLNVVFTYGIETAYFRFSSKAEYKNEIYSTASTSILISTAILTTLLLLSHTFFSHLLRLDAHPEYIIYSAVIIALDTLTTLPFARLRYEGRPKKFAAIRIAGILINIGLTYFFISVCPKLALENTRRICCELFIRKIMQ